MKVNIGVRSAPRLIDETFSHAPPKVSRHRKINRHTTPPPTLAWGREVSQPFSATLDSRPSTLDRDPYILNPKP